MRSDPHPVKLINWNRFTRRIFSLGQMLKKCLFPVRGQAKGFFQSEPRSLLSQIFFSCLSCFSLMSNMIQDPSFSFYPFLLLFSLGYLHYFVSFVTNILLWYCTYRTSSNKRRTSSKRVPLISIALFNRI